MCNECKELENNNEEIERVSLEDLSKEELLEVVYNIMESKEKEIDLNNDTILNSDSFKNGVDKASYYAGFYNCLINCGLSSNDAYELTMNQNTCDNNQKLQEIVNKGSIDVAKIQDEKQSM